MIVVVFRSRLNSGAQDATGMGRDMGREEYPRNFWSSDQL
jgi:hypothetical protein